MSTMTIYITAEYYNRLKMAGLITNDGQTDKGMALFTGFEGLSIPIRPRNSHQMSDNVVMQMVQDE